ncbi:MAG: DUF5305 family protein [Eubacteriales bacterium]|nr:DUF5305 family protein [Eubacteriales bacterium]
MKIMKTKQIIQKSRTGLILILLIASLLWTGFMNFPTNPTALESTVPADEILTYAPEYDIQAGRSLMIWKQGTSLEQGRTAYFYAADPILTLTPSFSLTGQVASELSGTVQIQTYLQAVDDNHQLYWSYPLINSVAQPVKLTHAIEGQNDLLQLSARPFAIRVSQAFAQLQAINTELDLTNANFELVVRSFVNLDGQSDGQVIAKQFINELPISLQTIGFTLPKTADNLSQIILKSAPVKPTGLAAWTTTPEKIAALFLDGLLLAALILSMVINRPRQKDRALDHQKFREWITEGSVSLHNSSPIQVNSLEGLVDLAIDLDKRVLYDPSRQKYFVPDEGMLYLYDPNQLNPSQIKRTQLGRLLLDAGVISREQLETALFYHQRLNVPLGESLIALGFIEEKNLYQTLAAQAKLLYLDAEPEDFRVDTDALARLTVKQAQILRVLPLQRQQDEKLRLICSDPGRIKIKNALEEIIESEIELVIVNPSVLQVALDKINAKTQS